MLRKFSQAKKIRAFHEARWFLKHARPVVKISVEFLDKVCFFLGGRVAEELFFNSITSGAADNLQKVTDLAYTQIVQCGMSSKLGPMAFVRNSKAF
ncbi:hypothetical protein L596_030628 [Steinernema carpocapsae]|uniref:Peptidase M41 domain-containing protein n=1 Tax=Steinernema carpocapsae TaxID=34508 RepID=A0A4U5LQ02_STECR|nr:hypothetical protein L596_030628 [Steinernema carpocapsae]